MKIIFILMMSLGVLQANDLLNPADKEAFFGNSKSLMEEEIVRPLNQSLVKAGECLKYKKNGETYWTKYETEIIKIESIGKETLKVRRLSFINTKSNKWMDSEPYSMAFEFQMNYEITECPDMKDKMTEEEVKKVKELLKKNRR